MTEDPHVAISQISRLCYVVVLVEIRGCARTLIVLRITLEKLRSKDVAMHVGGVSVNYAYVLIDSG